MQFKAASEYICKAFMESLKSTGASNCPLCNQAFRCQPENIGECHCTKTVMNQEEKKYISLQTDDCLCNSCLLKMKEVYKNLPLYYIESGLLVMTEKYHLQRGTCCGNGCRHCPYRK